MMVIREYAKLARIHSAVLTGLTPVLGAIAVGMLELVPIILIFLAGFCTHIFGFVLNEYVDIEIDSKAKHLRDKPLIKGTVSSRAAILFALLGLLAGYILIGILFFYLGSVCVFGVILFTLAWLSIGIYDLTSKYVRGSDLALALWTGSLCLFGGFIFTQNPPMMLYVIAGLAFFQLMVQNILAGLKDVPQDKSGAGTTTPLRLGVRVKKNRLIIPFRFQSYIYSLKVVHLVLVFSPFIFFGYYVNMPQLVPIIFLLMLNFVLVWRIFNAISFSRKMILRHIGMHEILSYSIVPIMLFGIIDVGSVVFLLALPVVWLALFLKLIYKRLLPGI